jgi:hypothetical protein
MSGLLALKASGGLLSGGMPGLRIGFAAASLRASSAAASAHIAAPLTGAGGYLGTGDEPTEREHRCSIKSCLFHAISACRQRCSWSAQTSWKHKILSHEGVRFCCRFLVTGACGQIGSELVGQVVLSNEQGLTGLHGMNACVLVSPPWCATTRCAAPWGTCHVQPGVGWQQKLLKSGTTHEHNP